MAASKVLATSASLGAVSLRTLISPNAGGTPRMPPPKQESQTTSVSTPLASSRDNQARTSTLTTTSSAFAALETESGERDLFVDALRVEPLPVLVLGHLHAVSGVADDDEVARLRRLDQLVHLSDDARARHVVIEEAREVRHPLLLQHRGDVFGVRPRAAQRRARAKIRVVVDAHHEGVDRSPAGRRQIGRRGKSGSGQQQPGRKSSGCEFGEHGFPSRFAFTDLPARIQRADPEPRPLPGWDGRRAPRRRRAVRRRRPRW